MAKSVNEEWLDAMLRHQIGLLRLSGSISKRSIEILNSSDKKAKQEILLAVEEILDFDGIPGQSRTDRKLAALLVSLLAERGGASGIGAVNPFGNASLEAKRRITKP